MRAKEIEVGGVYLARVSGKITKVRVDAIEEMFARAGRSLTIYRVTNIATGRRTTFRSPQKFRSRVTPSRELAVELIEERRRQREEIAVEN